MGAWDPAKPNAGRKGARWQKCRRIVLERDTHICHICGHPGADQADHYPLSLAQLKAAGLDPDDPAHSRAAHGTRGCRYCPRKTDGRLRRCNPEAGDRGARRNSPRVDRGFVSIDPTTV